MSTTTLERVYGWMAAATAAGALLIAVLWYARSWDSGPQFPPPPPEEVTDLEALLSLQRAGLLFEFALPLLCVPAILFGVLARRQVISKIALLLTAAALLLYLVQVVSCGRLVYEIL